MSLAALCALASAVSLMRDAGARPDTVTLYEDRFASLRRELPAGRPAGYVTDLPPNENAAWTELRLVQYAVAPVVVVNRIEPGIVIGNFHTAEGMRQSIANHGLAVLKDLGKGVVMLRR
ncbi:MAG: hypothetical protein ACRD96_28505 [Bryobacteraceae bacterium]